MRLLLAGALLLLAGCGSPPAVDEVDWSAYSPEWGQSVRDAVAAGDCDRMTNAWEAALGADDETLEAFLDHQLERAECPGW